jgi:hypothetical protein
MPSWAGGWDNMFGQPYALLNEPGSIPRGVARLMAPQAAVAIGNVSKALTGAVVGGPVNAGYSQVTSKQADGLNLGGKVDVSATTVVNRNTTSADEILIDQQLTPRFMPPITQAGVETSGYPVEKSGNSGGGKTGTINS